MKQDCSYSRWSWIDMPRVHYAFLSGFVCEIFHLKREGNKGGRERRCERQKWEREGGRKGRQASWSATVKKTKNGNKYRKEKNDATTGILWNGTLPLKVAPFSSKSHSYSIFEPGSASWGHRKQTSLLYSTCVFSISGETFPPVPLSGMFSNNSLSSFSSCKLLQQHQISG